MEREDIEKIAHLACLQINEGDIPQYAKNLSSILALVEKMNATDTRDVLPMSHPLAEVQRLRADVVTEKDQRDYFQQVAPQVKDGLYLVPKVIE